MSMDLYIKSAMLGGNSRLHEQNCAFLKLCMQVLLLMTIVAIVYNAPAAAQAAKTRAAAPAPAPAPSFENVTQSLVFGGDYSTFIELLVETKVDVIFQTIANDTEGPGITIFAPTDDAFKTKLVSSLLKNLTALQKVRLVEYHALNAYQAFKNLQNSNNNVTSTYATFNGGGGGGRYQVNLTFTGGGRLEIASGWTTAKISTTVYSQKPVSIFAIDQVLLPDEIFGLPPPPPPAAPPPTLPLRPSPAPSAAPPPPVAPRSAAAPSSSPAIVFLYLLPFSFSSALLFSLLIFQALVMQVA